jgi:hypothetical protein
LLRCWENSQLSPGRVTYDLRRLHLHGLIDRIPKSHRYRITAKGLRTAIFYTRLYNRALRTGLAVISPDAANVNRRSPDPFVPPKLPSTRGMIQQTLRPEI